MTRRGAHTTTQRLPSCSPRSGAATAASPRRATEEYPHKAKNLPVSSTMSRQRLRQCSTSVTKVRGWFLIACTCSLGPRNRRGLAGVGGKSFRDVECPGHTHARTVVSAAIDPSAAEPRHSFRAALAALLPGSSKSRPLPHLSTDTQPDPMRPQRDKTGGRRPTP